MKRKNFLKTAVTATALIATGTVPASASGRSKVEELHRCHKNPPYRDRGEDEMVCSCGLKFVGKHAWDNSRFHEYQLHKLGFRPPWKAEVVKATPKERTEWQRFDDWWRGTIYGNMVDRLA